MTSLSELDPAAVEEKLVPARVRVFQLVHGALGVGMMMFLVIILFLFAAGSETAGSADPALIHTLTTTLFYFSLFAVAAGALSHRFLFARSRLQKFALQPYRERGRIVNDPAEKVLTIVQNAMVVRSSLFNAAALFGLTICMIGVSTGVLYSRPEYWINATPAFLLFGYLALSFPTRDKILAMVREKVLTAGRGEGNRE